MSKRSSRNKKGGDSNNVPNFVFQMGDVNSGFGSTPSSPSGSVTGFSFSTPASPSTATFGTLRRGQSEINPRPEASPLRRATSDIGLNTNTSFNFTPQPIQKQNSAASLSSQSSFSTPATGFSISSTPPTSSAFSFSTTSTTATTTAAPPTTPTTFSFGTTTTPSTTTTSAFGKASAPTTTPPVSSFSFGTSTTSAPSTSAATISFGATTTTTTNTPASTFSFGSTAPKTSAPTTSTPTLTTAATGFSFGGTSTTKSTSESTKTPASTSFSFGATSSSFGVHSEAKKETSKTEGTEKKEDKPTVTSSPFTFGGSTTVSTPTAVVTHPTKPNQFSFVKVLEDLEKAATSQVPNQFHATLINPIQQTTHQTNFRIDNIMPTTRFTELPEQAQKELDELEKYIRLENQRNEYIKNHKIPHYLDTMTQSKKKVDELSQELDALSNTLYATKESIEILYDTIKTQLRHANDGSFVLEACKHPGNNARWLFGYTEEDDYFLQLSKQLNHRLEEYKKCIWEIERTAESWTQNKKQSPQDIADIMRTQNEAFMALSNKVAAIHESVNIEKNHYNQYLRMYSDK